MWTVSESQSRELNQHRTKTVENEAEVERLKRQLISERFERYASHILYHMLKYLLCRHYCSPASKCVMFGAEVCVHIDEV